MMNMDVYMMCVKMINDKWKMEINGKMEFGVAINLLFSV